MVKRTSLFQSVRIKKFGFPFLSLRLAEGVELYSNLLLLSHVVWYREAAAIGIEVGKRNFMGTPHRSSKSPVETYRRFDRDLRAA
jgi:hypothetical protein